MKNLCVGTVELVDMPRPNIDKAGEPTLSLRLSKLLEEKLVKLQRANLKAILVLNTK